MKRIALIGVLVLILAAMSGPALAHPRGGSPLPAPEHEQVLPSARGGAVSAGQPLADTGFETSEVAALGLGLLVIGGSALLIGRRRATG